MNESTGNCFCTGHLIEGKGLIETVANHGKFPGIVIDFL